MRRREFVVAVSGIVLTMAGGVLAQGGPQRPPDQRPRWGQQADRAFRLGRGLAPQLMTEEEWKEHQAKMRTMTPEERQRYRQEVHQKMLERAREKGLIR